MLQEAQAQRIPSRNVHWPGLAKTFLRGYPALHSPKTNTSPEAFKSSCWIQHLPWAGRWMNALNYSTGIKEKSEVRGGFWLYFCTLKCRLQPVWSSKEAFYTVSLGALCLGFTPITLECKLHGYYVFIIVSQDLEEESRTKGKHLQLAEEWARQ